jgi:predicted RNase H-like nuclease (RuvC/YqgF family)
MSGTPWVPTFPPTNPPTSSWYESKISLLQSLLQDSHTEVTKLENENEELEEEIQYLRRHVLGLKRTNATLREDAKERLKEAKILKAKVKQMREERRVERVRNGSLRELGAERRGRRLERENRMLKDKIEMLAKQLSGEGVGEEVRSDGVEDGQDVENEKMSVEVGSS